MTTIDKPANKKDLLLLQVTRLSKDGKNGISVFAKSEDLERYFRSIATNPEQIDTNTKSNFMTSSNSGWNGHLGYKLPPKDELKFLNLWGQGLIQSQNANISFLTAKGLGNGITFEFEGMFNRNTVDKFVTEVKKQVKQLWQDCLKENNWVITSEMRELE